MNARNTMTSPYHSKVRSPQIRGVQLFSRLGYGAFGKGIFFPENSNLDNWMVRKQIMCFWQCLYLV